MMRTQGLSTQRRLLQAALVEFSASGFKGGRLDRIAAAADVTKGALYHHFPDKRALGAAVLDQLIGQEIESLWLKPFEVPGHPIPRLIATLRHHMEPWPAGGHPARYPLQKLIKDMVDHDEGFADHLRAILSAGQRRLAECLQRTRAQGLLRADVDCAAAALFLLSSWEGCGRKAQALSDPSAFRSCGEELLRYIQALATPLRPAAADFSRALNTAGEMR